MSSESRARFRDVAPVLCRKSPLKNLVPRDLIPQFGMPMKSDLIRAIQDER